MEALWSGNLACTPDALIVIRAATRDCALVTNKARRLPARVREQGIEVLSRADLLAWIGFNSVA